MILRAQNLESSGEIHPCNFAFVRYQTRFPQNGIFIKKKKEKKTA